mmetsp:Transcript_41421/g.81168  ORF Transcript_41421/g.81168 Transcript_41421/m.81168 type:complete len:235 (+) Transcript_41421:188-892(+)
MSFDGPKYGGGRTRMGLKVILNLYDLSPMNSSLCPLGIGLLHSGVELVGTEYTFAAEAGIFTMEPKSASNMGSMEGGSAPAVVFREAIELGVFEGTIGDISSVISDLRSEFSESDYHLIFKNCNHFSNALSWSLLGRPIPPHVNRLANLAGCFKCLLPKQLQGGRKAEGSISAPSFSGSGAKLGATSDSSRSGGIINATRLFNRQGGSSGLGERDPLTDRREKARAAALARMTH